MADIGLILRKQQTKLGETLAKKSHFSSSEIENLLNVYRKLSEASHDTGNQFLVPGKILIPT